MDQATLGSTLLVWWLHKHLLSFSITYQRKSTRELFFSFIVFKCMPKHQENKYLCIPLAVVGWYIAINIERSHCWPSSWSKCLIGMIWRSQVRTYVGLNLGCIILDLKIAFLKMPDRYIQGEWTGIYFTVECHALINYQTFHKRR